MILSVFQWIVDGRKNFSGPRMDVDVISGQVAAGGEPADYAVEHGIPQDK